MGDTGYAHGCCHCCAFHHLSHHCHQSCHPGTVTEGYVVASQVVAYSKKLNKFNFNCTESN